MTGHTISQRAAVHTTLQDGYHLLFKALRNRHDTDRPQTMAQPASSRRAARRHRPHSLPWRGIRAAAIWHRLRSEPASTLRGPSKPGRGDYWIQLKLERLVPWAGRRAKTGRKRAVLHRGQFSLGNAARRDKSQARQAIAGRPQGRRNMRTTPTPLQTWYRARPRSRALFAAWTRGRTVRRFLTASSTWPVA